MADKGTGKFAQATGAVSNFFTTYRTPILIILAVAVVVGVGYYYYGKRNEGFNCGDHHRGMQGRYPPMGYMPYPGRETMYGPMNGPEEGFYDGVPQHPQQRGPGGHG